MKILNFLFVFIFLFIVNTQAWAHKTYSTQGVESTTSAQLPSDNEKQTIIYTVKKGDSLWKIAREFNLSVKELKMLNGIKSNRLKPEQKLIVGYQVTEADTVVHISTQPEQDIAGQIKELTESPEVQSASLKERVVLFAKKMLGVPYKFGSTTLNRIDCSAYVQKVFGFIGIPLPRTAREQFSVGEFVNKENLTSGDLVFFKTYATFPSHVGIYIGDNLFIHTSTVTRNVTIDNLDTPYYLKRFIGAKRLPFDDFN